MTAQGLTQPEETNAQIPQTKMGQYTLLEKVAQGGMAQVYKAKTVDPTGIERLVVIKRILPHISSQPEYVEMLIDEAKIAVHFTHGNIAQVYDLGRVGEDYFIVMEYVDGRTFSQISRALAERHQRVSLDILLFCFIELCHALSYIHRKTGPSGKPLGVVHRDISPQNIILSYAGNVKLIDFGVARADFLESRTEHGVLKGKFAYMSPEQTRGERIDHRSDLFSVGTLLWEMSTGERLFKRPTNQETIKAVQKAKFELPSERRADIPKGLDRIVRKALGRNPRQRYQDAADMAVDLEKLLFSINPDFRPVLAAKFLYDLFGPEKDEAALPPPFFVKTPISPESGRTNNSLLPQQAAKTEVEHAGGPPAAETRNAAADEEPTVREVLLEDVTPIVKISRLRHLKSRSGLIVLAGILLFVLGTAYALYVRELNKRAYLTFQGLEKSMTLYLNGDRQELPEETLVVASNTPHQIKITREGDKDFIKQITLSPRQEATVEVKLEKAIPPLGDLTVETVPAGAAVLLDGKIFPGKTPLTISNLNHGQKYSVKVELPNYKDADQDVEIVGGKAIRLSKTLILNYATLLFESQPELAEIYMDDQLIGVTPYTLDQVLPGIERKIRVSLPGYEDVVQAITLKPGEDRAISADLKPLDPNAAAGGPVTDSVPGTPAGSVTVSPVDSAGATGAPTAPVLVVTPSATATVAPSSGLPAPVAAPAVQKLSPSTTSSTTE